MAEPNEQIHTFGLRWPDERRGPWNVRFHFAGVGDRWECVGVDLRSFQEELGVESGEPVLTRRPGPGGLSTFSTSVIRSLPVKSLEREVRRKAGQMLKWVGDLHDTSREHGRELVALADELEASPRRWHTREHFEQVAEIYRRAWANDDPAPTKAVADELKATRSAAAKWVARARTLGLLGPTEQGRAAAPRPAPASTKTTKRGR